MNYGFEGTHHKLVNGIPQILNADKSKKEVDYTLAVHGFAGLCKHITNIYGRYFIIYKNALIYLSYVQPLSEYLYSSLKIRMG